MMGDPNGWLDAASKAVPIAGALWLIAKFFSGWHVKGFKSDEEQRASAIAIDRFAKALTVLEKAQQEQEQKIAKIDGQTEKTCEDVTENKQDIKEMRAQIAKNTSLLEFMRGQRTRDRANRGDQEDNG